MDHEFKSEVMDAALGRIWHAVGKEDARPILTCVLFEGDEHGFRLVAADNYRLAVATISTTDHSGFGRVPLPRMYVPTLRAFLKQFKRLIEVRIDTDLMRLVFLDGSTSVALRYMDGKFPDYASVIPTTGPVMGVNPAFLADTAAATKGLTLKLSKGADLVSPFLIEADNYREAIMPVKVA